MTLGVAIFASVVLILLVYRAQFRKVFFWIAGISAVAVGLFYLSMYLYSVHEERKAQSEQDAVKKAVDDCIARYSTSHYVEPEPGFTVDVEGTCQSNPNTSWKNDDTKFDPNKPYSKIVEIHGGETLKVVHDQATHSQTTNGVRFDMSTSVPLVYLGHGQKFVFACGNYGEQTVPSTFPTFKNTTATCP